MQNFMNYICICAARVHEKKELRNSSQNLADRIVHVFSNPITSTVGDE